MRLGELNKKGVWASLSLSSPEMDLRDSIAEQTAFSLRLAGRVAPSHAAASNLAFSPLSLHVALSLVAAGSTGETLEQLASFLRPSTGAASPAAAERLHKLASEVIALVLADGSPVGGPRLSFASGVWVDQSLPLKPAFKQLAASAYKAESRAVDFQTKAVEVAAELNSWVESATSGLIRELIPAGSVGHLTRLVLANALYFKGAWSEKFDASQTKDSAFHLLDGSPVRAPFMTSKKKQLISANDGFKVLKLPYLQGDDRRQFSMCLFLPDGKDGLWGLVEKLSSESAHLDRYLPMQKVEVGHFEIPKFKISFGFEASRILKEMGLTLPFSGGELTEMVDSPLGKQLVVSSICHKSFVEVNEEGTEVAAASAVVTRLAGISRGRMDFVADHPFLFLIREDLMGVVLFVGHVLNPLLND
uniref:Serpin-ZX n=1 Tax=Anthurium amnicola TaxID=1678845 RepID=A0A1D1XWS9_9ARAE